MSQQFLHHFEFCPDTAQESRKGVPKRMPSESFLNSGLRGGGTNISPQDRLAPDRFPATVLSACKNPMVRFVVTADLPPFTERLQDDRMNWHRLLRRFGLTRADDTTDDGAHHVHRVLGKVDIAPLQTKQLALT